jgi:hypothetical protein
MTCCPASWEFTQPCTCSIRHSAIDATGSPSGGRSCDDQVLQRGDPVIGRACHIMISHRVSGAIARRWGRLNGRLVGWIWARRGPTQPMRLGTAYGGWRCYTDQLHPGEVALCIGVGEDVSFDVLLNARYGLHVECVDLLRRAPSDTWGRFWMLGPQALAFRLAAWATSAIPRKGLKRSGLS